MPEEYRTVKQFNSDEYIVKRSRFIGYAKPVVSVDEANAFIAEIKSKHWDATHNVYAYILREGGVKRYSDDGEPQGTAGVPVLDVLEKERLVDTAVVVTRYFGGILLGGGGLVRAYSHSAKIAVDSAKIITMALCLDLKIECDYNFYGKLGAFLSSENTVILDTVFTDSVTVIFRIKKDFYERFSAKLTDLSNGKTEAEVISENFCEF
ncbi:MAG: YigZ family protein [Candidatus Fimenecus sp.]